MAGTPGVPGHIRIDNRLVTHYAPRIGSDPVMVYLVLKLPRTRRRGGASRPCGASPGCRS